MIHSTRLSFLVFLLFVGHKLHADDHQGEDRSTVKLVFITSDEGSNSSTTNKEHQLANKTTSPVPSVAGRDHLVEIRIDDLFVGHALLKANSPPLYPVLKLPPGPKRFSFRCDGYRIGEQGLTCLGGGSEQILVVRFIEAPKSSEPQAVSNPNDRELKAEFTDEDFSAFVARDEFDGKTVLSWRPVRPDPTHVSLTKNPGKLTITTQCGSIHRDETDETLGGIPAKNIYLIDNPLSQDADFTVTTCVNGFTPHTRYQQAGLIVYNDDDNYLKWGYEYNWPMESGQRFCILTESTAQSDFEYVDSPSGLGKYWLRLKKRGNQYEHAFSTDGKAFKVVGIRQWDDGAPKRIGLIAKNGGNKEADELDAQFEFFELRAD